MDFLAGFILKFFKFSILYFNLISSVPLLQDHHHHDWLPRQWAMPTIEARSQIDIQVSSNRDGSHIGKSPDNNGIPFALTFGLDTPFSAGEIHNSTTTLLGNWATLNYRKVGNWATLLWKSTQFY